MTGTPDKPSRRQFLKSIGGFFLLPPLIRTSSLLEGEDEQICTRTFQFAVEHSLRKKPIGEVMVDIGRSFLGSPYRARTLEAPGEEHLVVNLRGFDCVTFVENVLCFGRLIKKNTLDFSDYRKELQFIRYRRGTIEGYPSRLHYFSDWIEDNERKDVLVDASEMLAGHPYKKTINYMTTHRDLYKQLADNAFLEAMKKIEAGLSTRKMYYVPKEHVEKVQKGIQSGDIIGITTSIEGLDIIHTGVAVRMENGMVHYLHAPLSKGEVRMTDQPLHEYLAPSSNHTGIMVARPLEPGV